MSMSCLANTSKKLEITASLQAPSKSAVAGFEIQSEHRSGENSPGPSGWAQPGRLRRTKLGSCGVSGARMEKGWKNIGAFCFPSWICLWSWTPLCTCAVLRDSVFILFIIHLLVLPNDSFSSLFCAWVLPKIHQNPAFQKSKSSRREPGVSGAFALTHQAVDGSQSRFERRRSLGGIHGNPGDDEYQEIPWNNTSMFVTDIIYGDASSIRASNPAKTTINNNCT